MLGSAIALGQVGDIHSRQGSLALAIDSDESVRDSLAVTYSKLGQIQDKLGNGGLACRFMHDARALWETLSTEFPLIPEYARNLDWVKRQLESMDCGSNSD